MWIVEVLALDGDKPERKYHCPSERAAERLSRGVEINLDHARFYTRITPPKEREDGRLEARKAAEQAAEKVDASVARRTRGYDPGIDPGAA